ncbi:glycosyltransferase [Guptibacillus hwajinpoensis]|uniref:glycosyltransferase n=1 Tax=Guptibacillus hwajinpoensis TaxID=208199 RepID=UPI003736B7B0
MSLQVLVSTMNRKNKKLIEKMNIKTDAIIINQCDQNLNSNVRLGNKSIKWINSNERGLSRSRNLALEYATGELCVLADDDLEYVSNYENIIKEQFELNPTADIITFQVEGIERKFKTYGSRQKKINFFNSMKVSSVEIAFRLESIKKKNIKFNSLFGAGAQYSMGEENIFLSNCINEGLKIIYVPLKIADLHIGESSWFKGFNKEYFINRGAVFTAMSKKMALLLIFQFAIRKHKAYSENFSLLKSIKYMLHGKNKYMNNIS